MVDSYAVEYKVIGGRDALLAATGSHPYVMLTTTGDVTGYRADGLLGWIVREPDRTQIFALGEAAAAVAFVRQMRGDARWAHLPHLTKAQAAPFEADVHDDWEHLIIRTAPPPSVMSDADGPRRLYERLGYGEPLERTSLRIPEELREDR